MRRIDGPDERRQLDNEHIMETGYLAGIDPHKYRVTDDRGRSLEEGEFFVLRRGDALAIATLRSYVANALTILDLERVAAIALSDSTRNHLSALADDVSDMAAHWETDGDLKLPD